MTWEPVGLVSLNCPPAAAELVIVTSNWGKLLSRSITSLGISVKEVSAGRASSVIKFDGISTLLLRSTKLSIALLLISKVCKPVNVNKALPTAASSLVRWLSRKSSSRSWVNPASASMSISALPAACRVVKLIGKSGSVDSKLRLSAKKLSCVSEDKGDASAIKLWGAAKVTSSVRPAKGVKSTIRLCPTRSVCNETKPDNGPRSSARLWATFRYSSPTSPLNADKPWMLLRRRSTHCNPADDKGGSVITRLLAIAKCSSPVRLLTGVKSIIRL